MTRRITGGCLCRSLRHMATGAPQVSGICCGGDCREASGSGFIPFMGCASDAIRFTGATLRYRSPCLRGGEALRKSCPTCGGRVFTRDRPGWLPLPPGPTLFETMPA